MRVDKKINKYIGKYTSYCLVDIGLAVGLLIAIRPSVRVEKAVISRRANTTVIYLEALIILIGMWQYAQRFLFITKSM